MASGSSDGLINIYDLKSGNEDDALVNSLNTESTVVRIFFNLGQCVCEFSFEETTCFDDFYRTNLLGIY